tara:strand:- start:1748 stop:2035 length:288 start_codon:yes stop_codon:yes gene_type:complete
MGRGKRSKAIKQKLKQVRDQVATQHSEPGVDWENMSHKGKEYIIRFRNGIPETIMCFSFTMAGVSKGCVKGSKDHIVRDATLKNEVIRKYYSSIM